MIDEDNFYTGLMVGVVFTVLVILSLINIGVDWQLKALDCHPSVSMGQDSFVCYRVRA
jgi:hypothetical protein